MNIYVPYPLQAAHILKPLTPVCWLPMESSEELSCREGHETGISMTDQRPEKENQIPLLLSTWEQHEESEVYSSKKLSLALPGSSEHDYIELVNTWEIMRSQMNKSSIFIFFSVWWEGVTSLLTPRLWVFLMDIKWLYFQHKMAEIFHRI